MLNCKRHNVHDSRGRHIIRVTGHINAQPSGNFLLARYSSAGVLDGTFGTGGVVTTDFGGSDNANAMAIQSRNGKIVLAGTTIDPAKSRAEIETLVTKHGATGYVSGWQGNLVKVMFEMRGRRLRFSVDLPDVSDRQFTFDGHRRLPPAQAQQG